MAATRSEFETKDCKDTKEMKSKVNMQRVSGVKGLHRILENYLRKLKSIDQAAEGQEEGQGCVGHVADDHDHDHSLALTLAHAQEKGTSLKLDRSNKSDVDVDVDSNVSDTPMLVGDQGSIWDIQDVHETQSGEVDADVDEPDLEQPVLLEGFSWADEESVVAQSKETGVGIETDTSESGNETWSMVVGRKEWQLLMARPGQKQGLRLDKQTGKPVDQRTETSGPVLPHTNLESALTGLSRGGGLQTEVKHL